MSTVWTPRDLDIAETLTRRVRLLSVTQVARIWWQARASLRIVRRRLGRLAAAGLIQCAPVNAHPPLDVSRPLASWSPGGDEPDLERVSERAKNRWREASIPTEVVFATRLAANVFGSTAGRLPTVQQRDHDLLLGQVHTLYRVHRPDEARRWIGEDSRPKAGVRIKNPDAFLLDAHGKPVRVIESAGHYSTRQCQSFHDHCVENEISYELW